MALPALVPILAAIGHALVLLGTQVVGWIRENAFRIARLTAALAAWVSAHIAAKVALVAAAVLIFDTLAFYIAQNVVTPLADDAIRTLIPEGSKADGIIWMLWDTGLSGRTLFRDFVLYVVNYTLLWRAFSTYIKGLAVSLSTYRSALRTAKMAKESAI